MSDMEKKRESVKEFVDAVAPLKLAVLKGLHNSLFWPKAAWRVFGDFDCITVDSDSKLLDKKAVEIGCRIDDNTYKHSHIFYKNLVVENHHNFTAFAGSKKGKYLEKELRGLFYFSNSPTENWVKLNDKDNKPIPNLSIPSSEFTATFLLAHAHEHFFYEGITIRHILDWYFFLTKEGSYADWTVIKPILEKTGLMTFTVLLTQFCKKYFNLKFEMNYSCKDELLEKFSHDLFAEHINPNDRRWHQLVLRIWQRFVRNVRFAELNNISIWSSLWKWITYASFFHRKPVLK